MRDLVTHGLDIENVGDQMAHRVGRGVVLALDSSHL